MRKTTYPRFCASVRAPSSWPNHQRSNGESAARSVRSNDASADAMRRSVTVSLPKAAAKSGRYDAFPATRPTRSSSVMSSSVAARIGPSACASRLTARPSQNSTGNVAALARLGTLRGPTCPRTPTAVGSPSPSAFAGSWQSAHDFDESRESDLSKNSRFPSATFPGSSS